MTPMPMTPRAKQVIMAANAAAQNLDHVDYVGTEHLLLGLVNVEEGVACEALINLGATPEKVRNEVLRLLGKGDKETVEEAPKSVVDRAAEWWARLASAASDIDCPVRSRLSVEGTDLVLVWSPSAEKKLCIFHRQNDQADLLSSLLQSRGVVDVKFHVISAGDAAAIVTVAPRLLDCLRELKVRHSQDMELVLVEAEGVLRPKSSQS